MPATPLDHPIRLFSDAASWESWLDAHHVEAAGLWLQLARKASPLTSVSYDEALEVALRYGWIDGQKRGHDADSWLQKFTPRGRRSIWSKVNRARVEALIAAGRMHPAGLAAVEAARADGRWDRAYDAQSTATVPDDLRRALEASPRAAAFFETLRSANRYAILFRIQTAVREETRARHIQRAVEMLERGEIPHA